MATETSEAALEILKPINEMYMQGPSGSIGSKIFFVRGKKAMLDKDLASLYGVSTSELIIVVKKNLTRFPQDFMFQLTESENICLRASYGFPFKLRKNSQMYPHYLFTENGITMLAGLLNSAKAIHVSIEIIRTFTKLRDLLRTDSRLKANFVNTETMDEHPFQMVLDAINDLQESSERLKRKAGS